MRIPLSSKENLPPAPLVTKKTFEAPSQRQHGGLEIAAEMRSPMIASPLHRVASRSASTPDVAESEVVRRVWVENRTLKKRIHHLEDELAQYKSQTADELARCKRQIEGLSEKLAHTKPATKRLRTQENENGENENHERIKITKKVKKEKMKEKASRRMPSKTAKKKAKTGEPTTVLVVPLACVPPPPAPPPAVVIEACAASAVSFGEAKKNLKRRGPMAAEQKAAARPVPGGLPSLNEVLMTRRSLRPTTLRPKPAVKQPVEQDDFKAALLKKFENVNIYSPFPTAVDPNDSFAEPPSPYRVP